MRLVAPGRPQRGRGRPVDGPDAGAGLLEAVVALALVSLVMLGLLSVSLALETQSRAAQAGSTARSVANDLAEVARANGCGFQTGSEPVSVLAGTAGSGVVPRCLAAYARTTGGTVGPTGVFGDVVITDIERSGTSYRASIEHRWIPYTEPVDGSLSTTDDLECADLATMNPAALARRIVVTRAETPDEVLVEVTELESLPPDAAATDPGFGAVLVTGLDAGTAAVDLDLPTDAGADVLRRTPVTFGSDTCAWFAMLAPRTDAYDLTVAGSGALEATVSAGLTTIIDVSAP